MDPATLAIVCFFGYFVYLVGVTTWSALTLPKAESLELAQGGVVNDPEFGIYNGYVCPTWDQNRIERELGGTDFMLCGNEECPACYPGKRSIEVISKRTADKRRVNIQGTWVKIPDGVPINAYGKWEYPDLNNYDTMNYVVWTWIDSGNGAKMYLRSSHPEAWNIGALPKESGPTQATAKPRPPDIIRTNKGWTLAPKRDTGWDCKGGDACVDCGITGEPLDPNYCKACAKHHTYRAQRKRLDKGYA